MHHFSVIGYGSPIPGSSEGDGEVHSSIVVLSCSGGTGPEQGDVSHPKPVTGGMEVCRNRYVTSVPVTLHQCDGCSGHTRSTLKATVALWPECGAPAAPPLSSPTLGRVTAPREKEGNATNRRTDALNIQRVLRS